MNQSTITTETVYTPHSGWRQRGPMLGAMWSDLAKSTYLARRLLVRDIKAQYRQSFLGILWAFVTPLMLAVGLTLAKDANVLNIGATDIPYPAYVMLSMTLWQTFLEGLNSPLGALKSARAMLTKIKFPHESLLLARLGEIGFNFGIKLVLIVALFLWFKVPVTAAVLLAPFALAAVVALGFSIGLFLAPLGLLYHDVAKGLQAVTSVWLFLTPVMYPTPGDGLFGTIVRLNPLTPLLVTTRELATTGIVSMLPAFLVVSGLSFIGLVIAWIGFRLSMPFVIERLGT